MRPETPQSWQAVDAAYAAVTPFPAARPGHGDRLASSRC